jgi:hypothetical protein
MRRIWIFAALLFWGSSAFSSIISNVTGADMIGIEVTAFFTNSAPETATWVTTGTDASIPYQEGFSGGAFGTNWSLRQQGDTFGEYGPGGGQLLGLWTLEVAPQNPLAMLYINTATAGVVFDYVPDFEVSPGSSVGRYFISDQTAPPAAMYFDTIGFDLAGTLALNWMPTGQSFTGTMNFMADTDMYASVPEPSSVLLLTVGLIGLAFGSKKRATSTRQAVE